jgi:Lrp/AsnC family transcriptional regulator, regulator for asnA, asnC and gidA
LLSGSDIIDETSLQIIKILSKDSSVSFVDIAKILGVSDATVHMRVKRLIASGVIKKFTISIDNRLLGYDHLAFMGINIRQGSADEVTSELTKLGEILEIHELHGRFDLLLKIRARNLDEMRSIVVNKIRKMTQVVEVELMTVLKSAKEEPMIDLDGSMRWTDAAAS